MNILYIAPCVPYPPDKGEKIRAFHQIRYLAREHTIHLACLINSQEDAEHLNTVAEYCATVDAVYRYRRVAQMLSARALVAGQPFSVASCFSRGLKRKIDLRLRTDKCDRILVFSSAMAPYVSDVSAIPKVMDFVDVDSELWRVHADYCPFPMSWIYRLEATRLARYEEMVAGSFDRSILVSEVETKLLRLRVSNRPISAVPNGVDLDYFAPVADSVSPADPVLLFTGTMDYFPNIDAVRYFCQEILPLVHRLLPEARFSIVGRNPPRAVQELGRTPHVTVTGSVPDVRPYLAKAAVMVAPFRMGRGIHNKILEAMACGVPVVGTSTAFQGLEAPETAGVRLADEPREFAREVVALLADSEWRRRCALHARRYVQSYHQWQQHGAHLVRLLREAAEGPPMWADGNGRKERSRG